MPQGTEARDQVAQSNLHGEAANEVTAAYDGGGDVLYLSIGAARPSVVVCEEPYDVLHRSFGPDGPVEAITIIGYLDGFVKGQDIDKMPSTTPQAILSFLRQLQQDPQRVWQYSWQEVGQPDSER